MKLEKAIAILSASANMGVTTFDEEYKQAQRLGIEALKLIYEKRTTMSFHPDDLLPGETKD